MYLVKLLPTSFKKLVRLLKTIITVSLSSPSEHEEAALVNYYNTVMASLFSRKLVYAEMTSSARRDNGTSASKLIQICDYRLCSYELAQTNLPL